MILSVRPPDFGLVKDYPILYVDDEEPNLVVFQATFADEFDIVCTSSPTSALELLASQRFALLMCDQRMPGMSGIELCQQVRERFPAVHRILVTAYSDQKTAIDAINRGGVLNYLVKPWNVDEVRQLLRDAIARVHLERMVLKLSAAVSDRERLAGLAATRAHILHDLAAVSSLAAACCMRLEQNARLVEGPPHAVRALRGAVLELRAAVDYVDSLHRKTRALARLEPAARGAYRVVDLLDAVASLLGADLFGVARLVIECPDDLYIWTDWTDVSRILLNLVTNSREAMEAVGIREGEVRIVVERTGVDVSFRVADSGPGIPASAVDRLFDVGYTTKTERASGGLGLAICRELARANDGTVDLVTPSGGRGATFVLKVPMANADGA